VSGPRGSIIDVHAHLLPEVAWNIPTASGMLRMTEHGDGIHLGATPIAVGRTALSDPRAMLDDMDRAGIDVRVVSPPPYAFPLDAAEPEATEYCALVTDALVDACRIDPARLIPVGIVPLRTVTGAEAAMTLLAATGARGVAVPPIIDGSPLGQGVGRGVLAAAARAGLPVLVHPVQAARPELATHYLRNLIGNPYETSVAIASCALSGVLDEIPALRILFVHAAGGAPMIVGRWDHGWRNRPDVGDVGARAPSETLLDRVFVDALAHHPGAARLSEEIFGREAMTLGSDYPFDMGDPDPIRSARQAGMDESALSRNAWRWLGEEMPDTRIHATAGALDSKV
jgi:aminocarboxymuconate-semialdehyde decarboxylase